jgi:tryptophan synthase beta chain
MSKIPYRIYLSEDEIPSKWYNLSADMKEQNDPYKPGTMKRLNSRICCRDFPS